MTDEFDAAVRSLNAERARPTPNPPPTRGGRPTIDPQLLRELIALLATLKTTPPDRNRA